MATGTHAHALHACREYTRIGFDVCRPEADVELMWQLRSLGAWCCMCWPAPWEVPMQTVPPPWGGWPSVCGAAVTAAPAQGGPTGGQSDSGTGGGGCSTAGGGGSNRNSGNKGDESKGDDKGVDFGDGCVDFGDGCCVGCVTRRKQHRQGIASNDNTMHATTARSRADLTKPNQTPTRYTPSQNTQ